MEHLEKYTYRYPHPAVTCDCVIFGFDGHRLQVLLIERGVDPYIGQWALPGGFMKMDETADQCAKRELREETGLDKIEVRQFHTFSSIDRDPRERVVTIAYLALVKIAEVKGGDDARKAQWFPLNELPPLAFDHNEILLLAFKNLKERIYFEPVGFELLPEVFKMSELQTLYEEILQVKFDRRNFYKKINKLEIITETNCLEDCEASTMNSILPQSNDSATYDAASAPKARPSRYPKFFTFNRKSYDKMKDDGFTDFEF